MRRWSVGTAVLTAAVLVAVLVAGAGVASAFEPTAGGWYWQNPLRQGSTFHDVAVTGGNAVAVGDAGAIYRSTNGGTSWSRKWWDTKAELVAVDLADADHGWAVGGDDVLATTSGGNAWTQQDLPGDGDYDITDVSFVNANDGWVSGSFVAAGTGARSCRVLRTGNGGDTWTVAAQWTDGATKGAVQLLTRIDFVNASTGWAAGWGYDAAAAGAKWGYLVLHTTDGGDTWAPARFGDGAARITAMDFASATDGWLATASIATYAPATIWRTTDGGATWVARLTKQGATVTGLAASPSGECFATGQTQALYDWTGFVLHSVDGGATWVEEYGQTNTGPEAVDFADAVAIAVGNGGLLLRRDPATSAWGQSAPGVRSNLSGVQFINKKKGWAVGWHSTILRTVDGGRSWVSTRVPKHVSIEAIDMVTSRVGWAVGCSGPHVPYFDLDAGYGTVILKTTDGGKHWKFQLNRTSRPGLAGVDFIDAKRGWAVGTNGLTIRTSDGGKTWWPWTVGTDTLRAVRFTDARNGVAVGGEAGSTYSRGAIWRTSDGGASWDEAATEPMPTAPLRAIQAGQDALGASTMYAIGDRGQLYASADGGAAWTYTDMTPDVVRQDPPFYHFVGVGVCAMPTAAVGTSPDTNAWALGEGGTIWSRVGTDWIRDQLPLVDSYISNHTGGSGTSNQMYGIAVVDWLNAWAVGENGTILSFDRQPPETKFSPANAWLKAPLASLKVSDGKSGVAAVRWVVDPPVDPADPTAWENDWPGWNWQYGRSIAFDNDGYLPGTRRLIYYQSIDCVGNIELDPFWLSSAGGAEVPRHIWVTVDSLGPQTYAPSAVKVKRGKRPAISFWVNDDLSDKARVTIDVKNASGKTKKTLKLGWLSTSQEFSAPISTWKCTLKKGDYTFVVHAQDQAGNREAVAGGNTFIVR